jgi:4-hydroxymandelate oxidase
LKTARSGSWPDVGATRRSAATLRGAADTTLEEIAAVAKTPLWFQLYIQHEPALTRELVQRAEAAGYGALVVTVDSPVDGARNRQARAGYR